ncbi:MAG: hypothetical protein RLZZ52_837 [Actinomycetota bacterium]
MVRDIVRQLVRVEKDNLLIVRSIRTAAISTVLPMIAWAAGVPQAMIPLGVGALFAGIAESNIHPAHRGRIMLWATVWLMVTSGLGFMVAWNTVLVVVASACVAALSGWVGVAGSRAGIVGVLSLVLFTITAGLPETVESSGLFVLFVGVGGLVQTAVFVLVNRVRPGEPGPPPQREASSVWFRVRNPGSDKGMYLRHTLSVTIAIVIATALSQFLEVPHEYWIPMTVAWIFKPNQKATTLRVAERVTGTLLAIGLAFLWGTFLPAPAPVLFVLCGVGAYLVLAFLTGNYSIATFGVTTFVLALFAVAGDLYEETVIFRLIATLTAGLIVVVVIFLVWIRSPRHPDA